MALCSKTVDNMMKGKMMKRVLMLLMAVVSLSSVLFAAEMYTVTTEQDAVRGAYIAPSGSKGGYYFDIETRTNVGSGYAYWGLLRWDLTDIRTELDANLGGSGKWEVTKVELTMYRTSYSYSASGDVDVRFTTDDVCNYSDMINMTDGISDPIGDQLDGVDPNGYSDTDGIFLSTIYFEDDINNNYVPLTYTLYDAATDANSMTDGQAMFIYDIASDIKTTLCFVDNINDYTVSAAWAGPSTTYSGQKPYLTITAQESEVHIPVCVDKPIYDFDDDCMVTLSDFAMFISEWLNCGYADPANCE